MATIQQTDTYAPIVPKLIIKELSGRGREIQLTGRALPIGPIEFSGGLNVEVTRYAGNPIATGTVTGVEEEPTTISGEWKDKYIRGLVFNTDTNAFTSSGAAAVSGQNIDTVEQLVELFDSVRRSGQLLQVTWGRITRRGFLKNFKQTWKNTNDCGWACTFEWVSQGEPPANSPVVDPPRPGAARQALRNTADALGDAMDDRPGSVLDRYRAAFDTANRAVTQAGRILDQYEAAVGGYIGDATAPLDLVRNCMTLAGATVGKAQEVIDFFEFVAPEEFFLGDFIDGSVAADGTVTLPPIADNFGQQLLHIGYSTEATFQARILKREAAIEKRTLGAVLESDLLGVYYARAGETLRDVSRTYYNAPDQWRELMLYNDLTTPELTAGQLVLIPRMSQGSV